jgi:hypothetical protein
VTIQHLAATWEALMTHDMAKLFALHEHDHYATHRRHLNEQMVRVLKATGYDVGFCSGKGQYLYDRDGNRYLDLLSGFGVFAIGRNHPALCEALKSILDSDLPNLVQMDVSTLAGILAERLLAHVPYLDKVCFVNSGSETVEAAIKFAQRAGLGYFTASMHSTVSPMVRCLSMATRSSEKASSPCCPTVSVFHLMILLRLRRHFIRARLPHSSSSRSRVKG